MHRDDLTLQPTAFVGRTRELAEVIGLLDESACRLLTLVGPGGIGKTRLALEVGSTLRQRKGSAASFPHNIYFVPLQALSTPDFILSALAEAIEFQFGVGGEPVQQIIDYLVPQNALLILDNFEHLLDGVDLIARILQGAAGIKILATSRETLNLREEWLYPLSGMAFPGAEQADEAEHYDAVQFFIQNARKARPDFSLPVEQADVLRICQIVEGMPLALEMTAAWLRRLPSKEIVAELRRGLDILEDTTRNAPPRHRSMRIVFEQSWNLLSENEREVFKKLSVFRGGFRREAAQSVAGATFGILGALVDKSLLRVSGGGRCDMHELLRQYAEEQLNATPPIVQQTHAAHCDYYLKFLLQRRPAIYHNKRESQRELFDEMDNLRAAWDWGIEYDAGEPMALVAFQMHMLYRIPGLYQEGEQVFAKAAHALRGREDVLVIGVLLSQGRCLQWLGKYDAARRCFEESLAISRKLNYVGTISSALIYLSEVSAALGDYPTAWQLGEEALIGASATSNVFSTTQQGRIALAMGKYDQARQLLEEAALQAQREDVPIALADARNSLGQLELALQNYPRAEAIFEENVHYIRHVVNHEDLGYPNGESVSLMGLGTASFRLGAYQEARRYFAKALRAAVKSHETPKILDVLAEAAPLIADQEHYEYALRVLVFVLNHRATSYEARNKATALLAEIEPRVLPGALATANDWSKSQLLDTVVQLLLDGALAPRSASPEGTGASSGLLTDRELEILRLIGDGLTNREIAERLFLALGTVKWYAGEIYSKLHVGSRTRAIARARELNLLPDKT